MFIFIVAYPFIIVVFEFTTNSNNKDEMIYWAYPSASILSEVIKTGNVISTKFIDIKTISFIRLSTTDSKSGLFWRCC